jgi:hypothetical protein
MGPSGPVSLQETTVLFPVHTGSESIWTVPGLILPPLAQA